MKIVISGGGIGGLTAALCFLHFGHEVTVLERATDFREVGAGIQVPPNAMKVFKALGLETAFDAYAFRPNAIEGRLGISGAHLFSIPLADTAVERWGGHYLHIHRADYISLLAEALHSKNANILQLGKIVTGYRQTSDGIVAITKDGTEIAGDVVVGADGIHSPIRLQMLGPDAPVFTGNVAWRAVVPMSALGDDAPRPTTSAWMGKGAHCVTYRLRRGTLANLVAVVECDDWQSESWTEKGSREEALANFDGWHPTIQRILQNADSLYKWALFDRPPLETWVDGHVTLLGDAAHPTLPFMAQGAAMAVEDAWVLAQQLTQSNSIDEALKSYQKIRFKRTSKIQSGSRANAKTFHRRTMIGRLSTYGPMWLAGKLAPGFISSRFDYLYGHDVTSV